MIEQPPAEPNKEKFFTAPLILIFLTVFIDLVGFGMVIPILPFYAGKEPFNANPFEIGLLISIYSWMQFFFSPILGKLSDRYGRRPILFISLLGSAGGYLILGFANTLFLVFLGRIISGITGGNISAAQAYIADVTTKENRAKGMGLFGAAFGLGFILGPAIAGILSQYGVHVPFYFAAVLSFTSAAGVYFLLPESLKPNALVRERKSRMAELFGSLRDRDFGMINLIYFLLVTSFSIMTFAFVLYTGERFGYTPVQNGYLFAFVGLVSIIGQGFLFGVLVRRFGETRLATVGCLLMAGSLFAVPLIGPETGGLAGLLIGCAVLSFGNALASPSLSSLASKITPDHEQGSALGIMQSGASLARAIGPTIGGILLNSAINTLNDFTLYRTFWTASGIMLVAFFLAFYSVRMVALDRNVAERIS
jgi:DHA1 family tetracycline resistance protein-like MFS transporter